MAESIELERISTEEDSGEGAASGGSAGGNESEASLEVPPEIQDDDLRVTADSLHNVRT